ncbi:MAG: glycosyltransferase [Patescibacteria group bacterium]|nr:glycosyltransferase [Patescibacteria group bacterium]
MKTRLKNPKVTVIMPVYNSEKYLRKAIESILNQTFTDFEFLIINDGSTDSSEEIIKSYDDPRIKFINNQKNIGVAKSSNIGLNSARGEYIAKMDSDDISLPKRLEIQVNFMDKNYKVGAIGGWVKIIGKKFKKYIKTPCNFEKIKATILFKNVLANPTAMIRSSVLTKHKIRYNESLRLSEDYDMWTKIIRYSPIINLNKILLFYRIHPKSVSRLYSDVQTKKSSEIKLKQLENLKIIPTEEEKNLHINTYKPRGFEISNFLNKKEAWLLKLVNQNKKVDYVKESYFLKIVGKQWLLACSVNANYDFKIFKLFWKSDLRKKLDWTDIENWKILTRFFFKCLLKN